MTMVADYTTTPTRKRRTAVVLDHKTTWTAATTTRRKTTTAYHTANLTGLIMQQTGLYNSAPIDQHAIC